MTANAGDEAREQCLQGGMNAYIVKPIEDSELLAVITSVLPTAKEMSGSIAVAEPTPPAAPEQKGNVVNRVALLARVGGKVAMLRDLIAMFRQDSGPMMISLAEALQQNDCKAVHHHAHTLKGMINFFGVPEVSELAFRLEKMGSAQDCSGGQGAFDALRGELTRLQAELDEI
jgi:HPt (histidine-containing phosphotransfer) domain-containing protein